MKDTLIYLLNVIVDHPDDVTVEETTDGDKTLLTIHVHQEDMGKVIGKQGRIIRSLRDIIKLIAAKHNTYVDVLLAE
jgi:uncharacterized protein